MRTEAEVAEAVGVPEDVWHSLPSGERRALWRRAGLAAPPVKRRPDLSIEAPPDLVAQWEAESTIDGEAVLTKFRAWRDQQPRS